MHTHTHKPTVKNGNHKLNAKRLKEKKRMISVTNGEHVQDEDEGNSLKETAKAEGVTGVWSRQQRVKTEQRGDSCSCVTAV